MNGNPDDTWKVQRYKGASHWPFVVLVAIFVAAYLICGWLELPAGIQSAITGLAGVVMGGTAARTWNIKNGKR